MPQPHHADADLLHVGGYQRQRRQCRRADGKTFTGSSSGIAQRIEGIGTLAHLRPEATHLGIATCIVGDRPISIGGQRDAQCGEHAHRRNGDAIKPHAEVLRAHHMCHIKADGRQVREKNGCHNGDHRDHRGDESVTHTGNNDGCGSCFRTLSNRLGGTIGVRGKIFCALTDDDSRQ